MTYKNFKKMTETLTTINDGIRECPQLFDTLAPVVGVLVNILVDEKYAMLARHPEKKEKIEKVFNRYVETEYNYGL
jgi:hypothetical protein